MTKSDIFGILNTAKFGKTPEAKLIVEFAYDSCLSGQTDEEALKLCYELVSAFSHIANSLKARQGEGEIQYVELDKQ